MCFSLLAPRRDCSCLLFAIPQELLLNFQLRWSLLVKNSYSFRTALLKTKYVFFSKQNNVIGIKCKW